MYLALRRAKGIRLAHIFASLKEILSVLGVFRTLWP